MKKLSALLTAALMAIGMAVAPAAPASAAGSERYIRCGMVAPTRLAAGKYRMAVNTNYPTRRNEFYYHLKTRDWKGKYRNYYWNHQTQSIVKTGILGTPWSLQGRQAANVGSSPYGGVICYYWG